MGGERGNHVEHGPTDDHTVVNVAHAGYHVIGNANTFRS